MADRFGRVNTFIHPNHSNELDRLGVLLCINGTGIQHAWMRRLIGRGLDYPQMENLASDIKVGSDGVTVLPFGNGAERMLGNATPGAVISGLDFNRHNEQHLIRAGLEGIGFAFVYGLQILREIGLDIQHIRVGGDNLFQSRIFASTVSTLAEISIEVVKTTGAEGAARMAGVGAGVFQSIEEAVGTVKGEHSINPDQASDAYEHAYNQWLDILARHLEYG